MKINIKIILLILTLFFINNVSAITTITTTYTCCKNFTTNSGNLVNSGDDVTLWARGALGNTTIGDDKTHFIDGNGSIFLNSGDYAFVQAITPTNFIFGTNKTVSYYAYSDDWSRVNAIYIYFSNTSSTTTKYIAKSILPQSYSTAINNLTGWQHFVFNTGNMTQSSINITDTIIAVKIRIDAKDVNYSANVSFDNIRYDFNVQKPQFFFDFDDGRKNVSILAEPILTANNQKGNIFVTVNQISVGDEAINLSQMHDLYNKGWSVGSHDMNHVSLPTLDNASLISELNDSFAFFGDNGFDRSKYIIAYPFGDHSNNTLEYTKKAGYLIGRTINDDTFTGIIEPVEYGTMQLRQSQFGSSYTVSQIKNQINLTIARNGSMHFLVHGIQNSTASYALNYNLTDFKTISDYVASRSNEIEVMTYPDLLIVNTVTYSANGEFDSLATLLSGLSDTISEILSNIFSHDNIRIIFTATIIIVLLIISIGLYKIVIK